MVLHSPTHSDSPDDIVHYGLARKHNKANHALTELENGDRPLRIVLTSPSIPYSLEIDGEWCRIIHNNQLLSCSKVGWQQLERLFPVYFLSISTYRVHF